MSWFTIEEVNKIHDMAIQAGLHNRRSALMGDLPPAYVSGLTTEDDLSSQVISDLQQMNSQTDRIVGDVVPLETWLSMAEHLTKVVPSQTKFFAEMLAQLKAKIGEGGRKDPPPRPPTTPKEDDPVLRIWTEKLEFLRTELPLAAGAAKFTLQKQIAEAEEKVREFGGTP